jgi:hypothetical protein
MLCNTAFFVLFSSAWGRHRGIDHLETQSAGAKAILRDVAPSRAYEGGTA